MKNNRLIEWKGGSHINEQQLIAQIANGDTEAFRAVMEQYYTYAYRAVYGVVKSHHDTEDVVQEVFVQVYKSLLHYRQEGFKSWIKRIAINKAIDYKRKKARAPDYEEIDETYSTEMGEQQPNQLEATIVRKERIQKVQEELNSIPESYQDIIRSFYIEQKSYAQISKELGVEVKTVESKLYRARKWLRQHWAREEF